jgi:hypothetical protein
MGMTIQVTASENVLHVLAEGEFDLDEARRTFVEMVDAIVDAQSEKVLFDGRRIAGEPAIIERFYYGEFVADIVKRQIEDETIPASPRFSYVLKPPVLDPERLGEIVAVNRGVNVKAFDNPSDAIAWLGLAPEGVKFLED